MNRLNECIIVTLLMITSPMVCLAIQSAKSLRSSAVGTLSLCKTKIPSSPLHQTTIQKSSVSLYATTSDIMTKVVVVSVCTAELCNCQEEGFFSGDDILAALKSKNLPYPVEKAPCLGACGESRLTIL